MKGQKKPSHKLPVPCEMPGPAQRVFYNQTQEKPVRKLTDVDIKFGDLTDKNVE